MDLTAIVGLITDAALGGLTVKRLFDEFQVGRDPDETKEEAAAAFAHRMIADAAGEDEADAAVAEWRAKHGN